VNRGYYQAPKVGVGAAIVGAVPAGLLTAVAVALAMVVVARAHAFDEWVLAGVALAAPWAVASLAVLAAAGVCRIARVRWHALALTVVGACAVVATAIGWLARAVVVVRGAPDATWPPDAHAAASGLSAAARHGVAEVASISPLAIALIAIEAIIIAAAAVWFARRWLGAPVCRKCGSWCPPQKGAAWAFARDPGDAQRALRDRDWSALRNRPAGGGPDRVRLDLQLCRSCGHLRAMNAWWVYPVLGADRLITDMLLAEDEVRTVREIGRVSGRTGARGLVSSPG
jgi:hypothetical protein